MLLRSINAPIIFISPSSPPDTGQQRRDATHRDVREGFAGRRDFAATVSNPSGKKGNDLIHFRSEKKRHAVLAVTAVDLTRWWSIIDQAKPIADDSLGHGGGGAEGNSKFIGALVLSTCSQLVRFLRKQMAHCCDLAPDA